MKYILSKLRFFSVLMLVAVGASGCFRHLPDSMLVPPEQIHQQYTPLKTVTFDDATSVVGTRNGLIVAITNVNMLSGDNTYSFINPATQTVFTRIASDFSLLSDLPFVTYALYDAAKDETTIESVDTEGNIQWKKVLPGVMTLHQADTQDKVLAVGVLQSGSVTHILLDMQNGSTRFSVSQNTAPSFAAYVFWQKRLYLLEQDSVSVYGFNGTELGQQSYEKGGDTPQIFKVEDQLYLQSGNTIYEIQPNGAAKWQYTFPRSFRIDKMREAGTALIVFGVDREEDEGVLYIVDRDHKQLIGSKVFEMEDDMYSDIAVAGAYLYFLENNRLAVISVSTGQELRSKTLDLNNRFHTFKNMVPYKDRLLLIGQTEIYAFAMDDLRLLWEQEELWTPYRMYIMELAAKSSAMDIHLRRSLEKGQPFLEKNALSDDPNAYLYAKDLKTLNADTASVVYIKGYSETGMSETYDAVVAEISLETGAVKIIDVKPRDSDRCLPLFYIDTNNRFVYQTFATSDWIFHCSHSDQLYIYKY